MIALARKYRPKRFADLIVQDHVAAGLRGAVAQGRVGHGYLFAGPRGVGKTTAARILAMALNCERRSPEGEPCGECDSCRRVWTGAANLDVVELDAASNRGVDDARDLRERAMYAASAPGRSKVYIVDEAHMLTRDAWNALLKILEEPPPGVVFVFATTEPHKIAQSAAPVLSRLQRFDFRRIGPHAIVGRLKQVAAAEHLDVPDDALHLLAKSADGGMRDALSLLDQVLAFGAGPVTAERVRAVLGLIPDDAYGELLRLTVEHDAQAVFPLVDRLVEAGSDLGEFVAGAGETLRAVLLTGLGGEPEGLTESLQAVVRRVAPRLPPGDVVRLLAVLAETEPQFRQSGNPRLVVELLLLRWTMLDRTVELEAVLQALGMARAPQSPAQPPRPPRPPGPPRPPRPPSAEARAGNPEPVVLHDSAPGQTAGAAVPPGRPSDPAPEKGPLTVERLRSLWSQVVAAARVRSPLLAAVLADAEVAAVEGGTVHVRAADANAVHAEGLERQRAAVAEVLGRYVDGPVKVVTGQGAQSGAGSAANAPGPGPARARPARLTEAGANAERLKLLRQQDPTLSAAVDALDLELLE